MPASKDTRRLSDLVEVWQKHHGINLRAKNTYSRLINLCRALGNPTADTFNVNLFVGYRSQRLNQGISANNLNREHAYLRAVFNELRRLGYWKKENPLALVRQFKIEERELSYLTLEQISTLLAELGAEHNRDAWLITRICLATGARWSEAEGLRVSHVRNGQIHFTGTKSGKNRSVPINDELVAELDEHLSRRYGDGRSTDTRYFQYAYSAFREAVKRAGLILPKGQSTHVLRHTFG